MFIRNYFLLFSLSFVCSLAYGLPQVEKIKLYTICTKSHEPLLKNWFLPSIKDDFDIIIDYEKQDGSGIYAAEGWNRTMIKKVDLFLRGIRENKGGWFIFSDVDIQFFRPVQSILSGFIEQHYDLIIQQEIGNDACTGFFACRGSKEMQNVWTEIRALLVGCSDKHCPHEQILLNRILNNKNCSIKWCFLPKEFFGGGFIRQKEGLWNPGDDLNIPANPAMHHANFTLGIDNKIKMLAFVKEKVAKMNKRSSQNQTVDAIIKN